MARRPKRFGKRTYKDHRDWKRYNEELVVRWTFFLDFSFVEDWGKELERMNKRKRGGQYLFPDSFMRWLAVWHQLVNYRGLEGIARKLSELQLIPYYEDFSTAWHRIHDFVPEIKLPEFKELNISGDGTGMRAGNSGRYLEMKYGKKGRGKYVVVVITVESKKKKLLTIDAHVEGKGQPSEPETVIKQGEELIENGYKIGKFNGDGAHDTNETFEFWRKHKTRCAIPPRSNAKIRRTRCNWRKHEIRKFRKWGYKKWREIRGYGDRLSVEGENSCVKRTFGENLASRLETSLCAEAIQKFVFYDFLKDYGKSKM